MRRVGAVSVCLLYLLVAAGCAGTVRVDAPGTSAAPASAPPPGSDAFGAWLDAYDAEAKGFFCWFPARDGRGGEVAWKGITPQIRADLEAEAAKDGQAPLRLVEAMTTVPEMLAMHERLMGAKGSLAQRWGFEFYTTSGCGMTAGLDRPLAQGRQLRPLSDEDRRLRDADVHSIAGFEIPINDQATSPRPMPGRPHSS